VRLKKLSLILISLFILLASVVFIFRNQIVISSINHYFLTDDKEVTCIDLSFTSSLDVLIRKACIKTPQATITIENARLAFSSMFQVGSIDIEAMEIKAKKELLEITSNNQETLSKKYLTNYLSEIAQFTVPLQLTANNINYLPFYNIEIPEKPYFHGQLITENRKIHFSLKDMSQKTILSAELTPQDKSFTALLNADLAKLQQFLVIHQLTLPAQLNEEVVAKGKFKTRLQWHEQVFTADSQLSNFSLSQPEGAEQNASINIDGMLSWQTILDENTVNFTIKEQSLVDIDFNDNQLLEYITSRNIPAALVSIIKHNPTHGLTLTLQDSVQVDLDKQAILLSTIELTSKHNKETLQVKLSDTTFSYHSNSFALEQINFAVKAKLIMEALNSLTNQPVKIMSSGQLKQSELGWKLAFSPTNSIEFPQLKSSSAKVNTAENTDNQNLFSTTKSVVNWQGHMHIEQLEVADLSIHLIGKASQLKIANLALIEQLVLEADITGTAKNGSLVAQVFADEQFIANVELSDNLSNPKFDVFASNLALTELLTLTLQLPIDISLIDGNLNYHLSGQLTDSANWLNNVATLNLSINDVTGEVDNTWIQELNWKHELLLSHKAIKTLETNKRNNLTMAKIEIAPPLTEVEMQTTINFKDNEFSIKASRVNAKLLGGRLNIETAQWPFVENHSVDVQLSDIDLEKLLELDPKQGIIVTGKISGILPISTNGKRFTISGGELHNISDGIIKVANNATVEQLKESDPQLKLAFDAMQNIHYHHLSSDVSMAKDGYMLFDTKIKGINPDLDNEVNLNVNLSYDLLGLLESLNITKDLEQNLIDKVQKN